MKLLEKSRAERRAAGLPDPTWREDPLLLFVLPLGLLALVGSTIGAMLTLPVGVAIAVGIAVVVLTGAAGLILRGIGELRASPKNKAVGYFLGAAAYGVTAAVALTNGLRIFAAA